MYFWISGCLILNLCAVTARHAKDLDFLLFNDSWSKIRSRRVDNDYCTYCSHVDFMLISSELIAFDCCSSRLKPTMARSVRVESLTLFILWRFPAFWESWY
jgi:hypothetical protein